MLTIILVASGVAAPLGAQYTSPGSLTQSAGIPDEKTFETHIDESAWKWGGLRVSPWVGLRDASLVSTSTSQQGSTDEDFTATAGAGLRGYLPTGKVVWTGHVLPEYVWWQDNENKRNLNGRYGLGLFGYFNRMSLELSLRQTTQQSFFSDEIQELTSTQTDISKLYVEVELARRLTIFGIAEQRGYSNEEDEGDVFSLLDRDEEVYGIGLRYRSTRGWYIALGYEDVAVDFDTTARNLSNSGTGPALDIGYTGARIGFRVAVAVRDFEADAGSDFGQFDEPTGSLEVLWGSSSRVGFLTYLRREQKYSVGATNSYTLNDRQGARLDYTLPRGVLSLSAEIGEDEYTALSGLPGRLDDVNAFGATFRVDVRDQVGISLQVLRTDYDSNIAGLDRDVTNFGIAVQLGALIDKLELGRSEGSW